MHQAKCRGDLIFHSNRTKVLTHKYCSMLVVIAAITIGLSSCITKQLTMIRSEGLAMTEHASLNFLNTMIHCQLSILFN